MHVAGQWIFFSLIYGYESVEAVFKNNDPLKIEKFKLKWRFTLKSYISVIITEIKKIYEGVNIFLITYIYVVLCCRSVNIFFLSFMVMNQWKLFSKTKWPIKSWKIEVKMRIHTKILYFSHYHWNKKIKIWRRKHFFNYEYVALGLTLT